jgi:hypothetical protein
MRQHNQDEENELYGVDNVLDIKLSYSRLSDFDQKGPKTLVKRSEISGEGVEMGGLVDLLLFTPEEFDKTYYVFNGEKPTASLNSLADVILNNYEKIPSIEECVNLARSAGLWSSVVKESTYIAKFDKPEFWKYLEDSYASRGKELITSEVLSDAQEIVRVLKTHDYSKNLVAYPAKHEEKYVQYPFEYRYKNVILRGLLDLLVIDHKSKTIKGVDLKTGAPAAMEFSKSFMKYRYYLQARIYQLALQEIMKEKGLEDYTILPFEFLYISRFEKIPLVYEVDENWQQAATYGFSTQSGYEYKGLDTLIEEVTWHWENQKFDLSKEVYEQNGKVVLTNTYITVNGESR